MDIFLAYDALRFNGLRSATGTSVRADQRSYFIQCNTEFMQLYDKIVEVMLQKGIVSRFLVINAPEQIDFVKFNFS